jgi:Reverse transcriptase (RNA-dependent DNA polymerase)/RNase H-like domain found in reverse transcriptase
MAYRNPNSSWCSAPLLVPKPGPSQFRFTVDLRPVNKQTVPQAWPMPHIESELSKVRGATCFATFDLSSGYWQLKLDESFQECQSFITPDGIYTPTRVLHGTRNAVSHIQACIQGILEPLSKSLLVWLDGLLVHATGEKALLDLLRKFLEICRDENIKLHPGKCNLFARTVRWCGRLITGSGVKFDPRRVQGLRHMSPPQVGADLQQFICALNWMRTSLPAFTTMIAPLHCLMEKVYVRAGNKRTKAPVAKISLGDAGGTEEHTQCSQACQSALEHAVTLAHTSLEKRVCLYTDASNEFWSSITTQVPPEDLDLPHADQRHGPLAFLSGSFVTTMRRWSVIEKEAYAVLASCERLDWLLLSQEGSPYLLTKIISFTFSTLMA